MRPEKSLSLLKRALAFLLGFVPVVVAAMPVSLPVPINSLAGGSTVSVSARRVVADDPRTQDLAARLAAAHAHVVQQASAAGATSRHARPTAGNGSSAPSGALRAAGPVSYTSAGPGQPLKVRADGNVVAKMRAAGTVRSLVPKQGVLEKSQGVGEAGAVKTVFAFLNRQHAVVGLENPSQELRVTTVRDDRLGYRQVRFAQEFRGLPVFGRELIAQVNRQGDLVSVHGSYARTPARLATSPILTAKQARERVRQRFGGHSIVSTPSLAVYASDRDRARLAWVVTADIGPLEAYRALIDAHDGSELLVYSLVQSGQASGQGVDLFGQTQTFTNSLWEDNGVYYLSDTTKAMYNGGSVPPSPVTSQGIISIGDMQNTEGTADLVSSIGDPNGPWLADGVSAAVNLSATYDYFLERLGRNSLNGEGGNLLGFVRVGQDLPNAYFNVSTMAMSFGDAEPFAGALDVVAHEMAHGVIATSIPGGLIYHGQSGALNEAFADIFGESTEAYANGGAEPDWLIGSNLSTPSRNMADPGALEFFPGRPYPSRMSEFVQPGDPVLNNFVNRDQDGVHINSSIINHAFYRLTHDAGGIDRDRAEQIFYRTLTTKLSAQSDFVDMRLGAVQSAIELYGDGSAEATATAAAFDAVEIFAAPTNPAPTPVPPVAVGADATLFAYWDSDLGEYYLGRFDPDSGDELPGIQFSLNPITPRPASVSGDGELAVFVDAQDDVCLIATDGLSAETCLGLAGEIASVAMAPDGETFGVIFLDSLGEATNSISVINVATSATESYTLVAPVADGESAIEVLYADAMDFTSDNRYLIYDAFNSIDFVDGSELGLWSIYAIDRFTGATIALTTPTPGINAGYPSVAQTSDAHIVFDAVDDTVQNTKIVALNAYTGAGAVVGVVGYQYTTPVYTGDDSAIVFSLFDNQTPTLYSLMAAPIAEDRITSTGSPDFWVADAMAGAVYRIGSWASRPDVDVEVTYMAGTTQPGHIAGFDLAVRNLGSTDATGLTWSVSKPQNVELESYASGTAGCVDSSDRIDCTFDDDLAPDESTNLSFRFRLLSASATGQVVSSATAFAAESDVDTTNNTALAQFDESALNIHPVSDTIPDREATAGTAASFSIASYFSDEDADALMYSASGLPASLSLNPGSGSITGTPTAAEGDSDFNVTVTATDTFNATASSTFTLSVNPAPEPPPEPPPPPPPPGSSAGSGGGGGAFGLLSLLGLAGLAGARRLIARRLIVRREERP